MSTNSTVCSAHSRPRVADSVGTEASCFYAGCQCDFAQHWHPAIQRYMRMSDEELASCDIAELNLTLALGLPGAESLDVPACLETLDAWAELVRLETAHCWPRFLNSPTEFDHSPRQFRMLVLVTVLQRDLGVRYNPACREGPYDATDSRNQFIHGSLLGLGGTCASLPVLYAAIGRRLGYPLQLAAAKEHLFVRWEEPGGERFNIEATMLGFLPLDDEHYHTSPMPLTEDELQSGLFLRSLAPREELALFFDQRGRCWLDNLCTAPALQEFYHAARLGPRLPGIKFGWAAATMINRAVMNSSGLSGGCRPIVLHLPAPRENWEHQIMPQVRQELTRIVQLHNGRKTQARQAMFGELGGASSTG